MTSESYLPSGPGGYLRWHAAKRWDWLASSRRLPPCSLHSPRERVRSLAQSGSPFFWARAVWRVPRPKCLRPLGAQIQSRAPRAAQVVRGRAAAHLEEPAQEAGRLPGAEAFKGAPEEALHQAEGSQTAEEASKRVVEARQQVVRMVAAAPPLRTSQKP